MSKANSHKSLIFMSFIFLTITTTTVVVSLLARGYRLNLKGGIIINPSGILSLTSIPKPASVYVNDRLITATDDTLNLPPGTYQVKISKDGYLPWQKQVIIKKELVSITDAYLFRSAPSLEPLSLSGVIKPSLNPDSNKVIFAVASASASINNGLYLAEFSNTTLGQRNTPKQLLANTSSVDWSQVISFEFSPDSSQVIATFANANYLIDLNSPNKPLFDITLQIPLIKQSWQAKSEDIIKTKLANLPKQLSAYISTESAQGLITNQTKDKIIYLATQSGQLDANLITPAPLMPHPNQDRQVKADYYYVYDLKQDANFLIGSKSDIINPFWLPNSNSLVYIKQSQLYIAEYDGSNISPIYSSALEHNLIAPWADGSRIVFLTSAFTPNQTNLYSLGIR